MSLTLRTDAELDDALAALAAIEGTSRQEVIRQAVLERLARTTHTSAVHDSTTRMLDQWSDVIERLGTA
ncbi:MAG: ribbon-helix-helix protein, CopG family [Candidatus Nanopelagicales bacterium]